MNVANTQIRPNESVMRIASGEAGNVIGIDDRQIKYKERKYKEIQRKYVEIHGNTMTGIYLGLIKYR